jgi:hypothetical protein
LLWALDEWRLNDKVSWILEGFDGGREDEEEFARFVGFMGCLMSDKDRF